MENQPVSEASLQAHDPAAVTLKFLQTVMPCDGYTHITTKRDETKTGGMRHFPIRTPDAGAELVTKLRDQHLGMFFSLAASKQPFITTIDAEGKEKKEFRSDRNWLCSKAFGIDIDCGNGKPYANKNEATKVVVPALSALSSYGLVYNSLVNSGGGLHVYFVTELIYDITQWRRLSGKLLQLFKIQGVYFDEDASSMAVGLLRLPGTQNNKLESPREVELKKHTGAVIPLAEFEAKLDKALAEMGVAQYEAEPAQTAQAESNRDSSQLPMPPLDSVMNECPAIRAIVENPDHEYPEWTAVINVARHCEDHETAIHEVSKNHRRYNPAETEAKAATFTGGPTLCSTFEGLNAQTKAPCEGCKHRKDKRVKTPIMAAVIAESEANGTSKIKSSTALENLPYATIRVGGKFRIVDCSTLSQTGLNPIELISQQDARPVFVRAMRERGVSETDAGRMFNGWLSNPDTKHFTGITFDPLHRDKSALNLWKGPSIEPDPHGTFETLNSFIHEVICAGSDKLHGYVMNWLAHAVQKPEEKPGVMLYLLAGQGTGKGTFFKLVHAVWANSTLQTTDLDHVFGSFNALIESAMFVLLDEALFAGSGKVADQLKGFVTEPVIQINQKNQPVRSIRSIHRLIAASNHSHAALAERDDRRGVFLRVSEVRKGDHAYFTALNRAIETESPALLAHLMQRDISKFNPAKDKPNTDEGLRQKIASLKGIARVVSDLLHQGAIPNPMGDMKEWTGVTEIRTKDIETRARELGVRSIDSKDVKDAMKTYMPKAICDRIGSGNHRARGYRLPDLETARADFLKALGGGVHDWD